MKPLIPLFPTLRGYQRGWLRADLMAGLAAGAVVIPQAMAYATIAGMPVQVGLYTCMIPMLVYAALGGSAALSTSTTSTIATLSGATLIAAGVAAGSLTSLATLTLEVGLLLLAGRLLHLGSAVENISVPVLVGVKSGIGLVVAVGQLPKLLGITAEESGGFFAQAWSVLQNLGTANTATLLLSALMLAILLGTRKVLPRIPAPLLAVVLAIFASVALDLPSRGVTQIDPVPSGLPVPHLPGLAHTAAMLPGAIAIAFMVLIESLSVARAMRKPDDPSLENDRELVAAGAANATGAFFGAMPGAGGFSQTAVNARAGARTQAAQLVTVALAVAVALWIAPILDHLPQAALAAIVMAAVLGLINPAEFTRLARIDRVEFWIAITTALVGLTAGLLAAVAVGVGATLVLVLRELNRVSVVDVRQEQGLLLLRTTGGLYTANIRRAQRQILDKVDASDPRPHVLILDSTAQAAMSVTVLDALAELDGQLAARNVELWIAALPDKATRIARRTRWWTRWEQDGRVWSSTEAAIAAHRGPAAAKPEPPPN